MDLSHDVICTKVDLESDGQVTWTWDPSLRLLAVSQGDKAKFGPELICVKYEDRVISTSTLLGTQEDLTIAAHFLASGLLKPKDETKSHLNPEEKKEILVSLSLPSLNSKEKASSLRKVRESIIKNLAS